MISDLLANFDDKVPAEGIFNDIRLKRQVQFGDRDTSSPGLLELTIMAMDEKLNPANRNLRFVAVRVKKSSRGGTVSSTCFHGTKGQVLAELQREQKDPTLLLEKVEELVSGLPEETNPNVWR